jgi:hypothetical protein
VAFFWLNFGLILAFGYDTCLTTPNRVVELNIETFPLITSGVAMPVKNPIHIATCIDQQLLDKLEKARLRGDKKITMASLLREILQEWMPTTLDPVPPLSGSLADILGD